MRSSTSEFSGLRIFAVPCALSGNAPSAIPVNDHVVAPSAPGVKAYDPETSASSTASSVNGFSASQTIPVNVHPCDEGDYGSSSDLGTPMVTYGA